MKRHDKLNVWAMAWVVLALVAANVMANGGGWFWGSLLILFMLLGGAFFIWSLRIQGRDRG